MAWWEVIPVVAGLSSAYTSGKAADKSADAAQVQADAAIKYNEQMWPYKQSALTKSGQMNAYLEPARQNMASWLYTLGGAQPQSGSWNYSGSGMYPSTPVSMDTKYYPNAGDPNVTFLGNDFMGIPMSGNDPLGTGAGYGTGINWDHLNQPAAGGADTGVTTTSMNYAVPPAQELPAWMQTKDYASQIKPVGGYDQYAGALSTIPDSTAIGDQIQRAYQILGNSSLDKAKQQRSSALNEAMARRGLGGSTYDASQMVGLQNWYDRAQTENNAQATLARIAAERQARGETDARQQKLYDWQRTNEGDVTQNTLTKSSLEEVQRSEQAKNYWGLLSYLTGQQESMAGQGDLGGLAANATAGSANAMNMANLYGQSASGGMSAAMNALAQIYANRNTQPASPGVDITFNGGGSYNPSASSMNESFLPQYLYPSTPNYGAINF